MRMVKRSSKIESLAGITMQTQTASVLERSKVAKDHGGKRPRAGRPATSERDDVTVKVDRSLVAKARYVAEIRGIPLAEYLTAAALATVEKDFTEAVKSGPPAK